MWAKMFGVNVDAFKNIIEAGFNCDISNVLVRDVHPLFNTKDKQELFINDATKVVHVVGESSSMPDPCRRCKLADIPRNATADRRFDIVTVVLHVDPPKTVSTYRGLKADVSELYGIDTSSSQPVLVSVWNDLALAIYESLVVDVEKKCNHVYMSISALRAANFQGFSLATTMSTEYNIKPVGDDAASLEKWCLENVDLVTRFQEDVKKKAILEVPTEIKTIANVLGMKERMFIGANLFGFVLLFPILLRMISKCLSVVTTVAGVVLLLSTNLWNVRSARKCPRQRLKSIFYFKAKDNTGAIMVAAYTKNAQKFLNVHADTLNAMSIKDRHDFIEAAREPLLSCPPIFIITPSPSLLSDHNVVKWMLKDVVKG